MRISAYDWYCEKGRIKRKPHGSSRRFLLLEDGWNEIVYNRFMFLVNERHNRKNVEEKGKWNTWMTSIKLIYDGILIIMALIIEPITKPNTILIKFSAKKRLAKNEEEQKKLFWKNLKSRLIRNHQINGGKISSQNWKTFFICTFYSLNLNTKFVQVFRCKTGIQVHSLRA